MIQGKVIKYGDNIDTDVIIPARYLNTSDPAELAKYCMKDLDETFTERVRPGILWLPAEILAAVPPGSMPHCHKGIGHQPGNS